MERENRYCLGRQMRFGGEKSGVVMGHRMEYDIIGDDDHDHVSCCPFL